MGGVKFSVCALILDQSTGKVLAVSRKDNKNDWGLPGGKVDPGETIFDALRREVKEETGLTLASYQLVFGNLTESKSYYCYTFLCTAEDLSELHTEEKINELGEGDIKWADWEEIEVGSFGSYNRHLHYAVSRYMHDFLTDIGRALASEPGKLLLLS